ncbi:DUF305 domain-containing protein [Cellulomonas sp.]|uniref:DUF305 domain-containing protein n=1 Tax=Cellulomonas sp. TaxID=40001 RepID=UPI0028119548|nr:DUF305 domain-containing protein [Cellulomonas sp.]
MTVRAPAGPSSADGSALARAWRALDGSARAVVALAVALALVAGTALGAALVARPDRAVPTDASVDAGFARDMQAHHAQAVQLSVLLRDRGQDPALRAIALDVLTAQQQQIGQFVAWLRLWDLPVAGSRPAMAWMTDDHAHAASTPGASGLAAMPGWVTPERVALLEAADGVEAERVYLALMIDHHVGGVAMAQEAAERAGHPEVRRLARAIVTAQSREVDVLRDLLDARGGRPPGLSRCRAPAGIWEDVCS